MLVCVCAQCCATLVYGVQVEISREQRVLRMATSLRTYTQNSVSEILRTNYIYKNIQYIYLHFYISTHYYIHCARAVSYIIIFISKTLNLFKAIGVLRTIVCNVYTCVCVCVRVYSCGIYACLLEFSYAYTTLSHTLIYIITLNYTHCSVYARSDNELEKIIFYVQVHEP